MEKNGEVQIERTSKAPTPEATKPEQLDSELTKQASDAAAENLGSKQ